MQVALGHRDGGGGRGVEGGAGLQQGDDLAAAAAGALDDGVELLLRQPAHLDEVRQRHAADGRVADQRHHVVAVAAERHGVHVLDGDAELLGEEVAEAGRVEHAGHADDLVLRQAGGLLQRPDHRVERVGDADDEGVGGVLLQALRRPASMTLRLMPSRSSRLMPGLRGTPAVTITTSAPAIAS